MYFYILFYLFTFCPCFPFAEVHIAEEKQRRLSAELLFKHSGVAARKHFNFLSYFVDFKLKENNLPFRSLISKNNVKYLIISQILHN